MRHLLLIDPLEKLNIKKDSSLMLALAMQKRGIETYVFFERDFAIQNQGKLKLTVHPFMGETKADGIYLADFKITASVDIELNAADVIHMRLDPPFDSRYLRILWMLDHLVAQGIQVMNDPRGIMQFNEKLYAYRSPGAVPSYVGANTHLARQFVASLRPAPESLIIKPMDLYSGVGVERLPINAWEQRFREKVVELAGPVIVQPFMSEVFKGEQRSVYFMQQELGTIIKIPRQGEFLSNIAQGATFEVSTLSATARGRCEAIVAELAQFKVDLIAFDILDDAITEVNVTCPGLLVEVSFAHQRNLADAMIDLLLKV
jgi:glutathione synthase